MLPYLKQQLKNILGYALTIISCVAIIVLGISALSRAASPITTSIGENISTNDLTVYGNATTTGAHYINGTLSVSTTTFNSITYGWPSADGANGQVLTTDGSGSLSWTTSSGGSGSLNYGIAGSIPFYSSAGTTATGTTNALLYWNDTTARLGIGTSSPYARLSVVGETVAEYFTATSTTSTSTFPYLSVIQSNIGTVVGGTWQGNTIGVNYGGTGLTSYTTNQLLYALDSNTVGQIATSSLGLLTTNVAEGLNLYWTNNRFDARLAATTTLPNLTTLLGLTNASTTQLTVANGAWFTGGNVGIGTTSPYAKLSVWGDGTSGATAFNVLDNASSTLFTVLDDGNVGIGNSNPQSPLQIVNTVSRGIQFTNSSTGSVIGDGFHMYVNGFWGYIDQKEAWPRAFKVNGLNAMVLTAAGEVGIGGDLDADALLEVSAGGGASNLCMLSSDDGNDGDLFIVNNSGDVGIGTTSPYAKLSVWGNGTSGATAFNVLDNASSTLLTVLDNGNVGINNSSPQNPLHIINSSSDGLQFTSSTTGSAEGDGFHMYVNGFWGYIDQKEAWPMAFKVNGSDVMILTSSGNVGIGGDTTADALLEVSAGGGASNLFMLSSDDGNDGDLFIVNNFGNVGIGTSTPYANFHIAGDNKIFRIGATNYDEANFSSTIELAEHANSNGTFRDGFKIGHIGANGQERGFMHVYSNDVDDGGIDIIRGTGYVGVGTTSPGVLFAVEGSALADEWLIYDIAEMNLFPENKNDVFEEGDLLSISDENGGFVKSNVNNNYPIIGVAKEVNVWNSSSTKPAILGTFTIKVSTENGDVDTGDYLTKSSVDGIAMRAEEGDQTVGFALEDYYGDGVGIIKIFINVDKKGSVATGGNSDVSSPEGFNMASSFDWIINKFKLVGVTFKNGLVKASEFIADKITAKRIVIEELEMKDDITGETFCITISSGDWKKESGNCGEVAGVSSGPDLLSQEIFGCTDDVALNYNSEATVEDESCVYVSDGDQEDNNNQVQDTNEQDDAVVDETLDESTEDTEEQSEGQVVGEEESIDDTENTGEEIENIDE